MEIWAWRPRCPTVLLDLRSIDLPHPTPDGYSITEREIQGQVGIDFDEQEVQVKFDDRLVNYELSDLDDVVLAYAISIHKSQGAEYPAVVVPLLSQHYIMLQRNLLYTAITRAKRLVVLVGSKSAVAIPVRNNKVQHRYTNLGAKLASS